MSSSSLPPWLTAMPSCAVECFQDAISNSSCSLSDRACSCADETFSQEAAHCIETSCSNREKLSAANQTYVSCGVEPSTDYSYEPILITFLVLTGVIVVMRLVARFIGAMKLWWDDYINFLGLEGGLGLDIWAVPQDNLNRQFQGYYSQVLIYSFTRICTRVSLCLFYLRIFQTQTARRWIWGTFYGSILVSLPFAIAAIFICKPIQFYWNRWHGEMDGRCGDAKIFLWAAWSLLLVKDFWLMALPIPFIMKLQLDLRKKLLVLGMFSFGIVVVAISIVKLTRIDAYTQEDNPTHDQVSMVAWAGIEIDVGVICGCLPSLPALFRPLCGNRGKNTNGSSIEASGYPGSATRYAVLSGRNAKSRAFSSAMASRDEDGVSDPATVRDGRHIQMVTTIHQSHEPSESQTHLPIHQGKNLH